MLAVASSCIFNEMLHLFVPLFKGFSGGVLLIFDLKGNLLFTKKMENNEKYQIIDKKPGIYEKIGEKKIKKNICEKNFEKIEFFESPKIFVEKKNIFFTKIKISEKNFEIRQKISEKTEILIYRKNDKILFIFYEKNSEKNEEKSEKIEEFSKNCSIFLIKIDKNFDAEFLEKKEIIFPGKTPFFRDFSEKILPFSEFFPIFPEKFPEKSAIFPQIYQIFHENSEFFYLFNNFGIFRTKKSDLSIFPEFLCNKFKLFVQFSHFSKKYFLTFFEKKIFLFENFEDFLAENSEKSIIFSPFEICEKNPENLLFLLNFDDFSYFFLQIFRKNFIF